MIIREYTTEIGKLNLISEFKRNGYVVVEDMIYTNGKFLGFRLKSEVDTETAENERLKNIWNNIKDDILWQGLRTASYQQIDNWIDNNVTNLAEGREVFKQLVKVVVYLTRHSE